MIYYMLYAICIASLEPQHAQTANSDKQQNKKQELETSKLKAQTQTPNPTHIITITRRASARS